VKSKPVYRSKVTILSGSKCNKVVFAVEAHRTLKQAVVVY